VVWEALARGESVLLEGAQERCSMSITARLPYVTSSNTTRAAPRRRGHRPTAIDAGLGVVKAYTTRVGNGPLPRPKRSPAVAERIRELGGEFGATTGRPRRCGWV